MSTPLTLDEYRAQVVQQLKACAEPAGVANLLSDVDSMLAATEISGELQKSFWQGFRKDLDLLAQQARLLDPPGGAALRALITPARAVIARYLRVLEESE